MKSQIGLILAILMTASSASGQPPDGMEEVRTICTPAPDCDRAAASPSVTQGAQAMLWLAASATAAGAAFMIVHWKRGLPLLPLFTRLRRDELLAHPVRLAIVERVHHEPGIHLAGLMQRLDIGNGAARHHVSALVRAGLIERCKGFGYVCLVPAGWSTMPPGLTRARTAQATFAAVTARGGCSTAEIAASVGTSRGNAHHHLCRMEAAGLITAQRRSGRVQWFRL